MPPFSSAHTFLKGFFSFSSKQLRRFEERFREDALDTDTS